MKRETAQKIDSIADKVHVYFEKIKETEEFKALVSELDKCNLSEEEFLSLGIHLKLFDSKKEESLEIYESGFQTNGDQDPASYDGGDGFEKFVLDGEIEIVTNGKCPKCYQNWDFKINTQGCAHCGIELGKEVFYLIDDDRCPHCEEGKVTRNNPSCDKCDYEADPKIVSWG